MKFTRTDTEDGTTLKIEGVLDAVTVPDIRPAVETLVAEKRMRVAVELDQLRVIDSSGVGVIVSLFKRARTYGGSVTVSGLRDQPLTIFKLLKLDRVFGIA